MTEEFIWWPAVRDQFKIEFGVEMEKRYGGNIANLMYSIHALVDNAARPLHQVWTLKSYTPQGEK